MNKIILPILFCLIASSQILQGQTKFSKGYDYIKAERLIHDNGYLLLGNSYSTVDFNDDIFLLKTNEVGDTMWTKRYRFYDNLTAMDFLKVDETGFIILAKQSLDAFSPTADISLIRINMNGDTLWTRIIDIGEVDMPRSIVKAHDGGYVIAGDLRTGDNYNILMLKVNVNGYLLWSRTFGTNLADIGNDIIRDNDNGFLLTGYYTDPGTEIYSAFLLKTNANGDSIWMKRNFSEHHSIGNSLIRTNDGGLMINCGLELVKTNASGDTLWTRKYNFASGGQEGFGNIIQTSDGGYLIGGYLNGNLNVRPGFSQMAVFKLDDLGNVEWFRKYATNEMFVKYVRDVCERENGYAILGVSNAYSLGKTHLIGTDYNGCFTDDPAISGPDYFCHGDSVTLNTSVEFDSYLWSTGEITQSIIVKLPGEYFTQIIDSNNCPLWSDTVIIQEKPLPDLLIDPDGPTTICSGESVQLNTVIQNHDIGKTYTYNWNNNYAATSSILVDTTGNYSVKVEDNFGCTSSDNIDILVHYPYQDEKICIITTDLETGKNIIVWEKTADEGIVSYNIYRETDIGVYVQIGSKPGTDLSIFIDETVDPKTQPFLYKITAVDSCGNESDPKLTPYHKPIFLQYVGSDGGINLIWTNYEIQGISDIGTYLSSFIIYRGTDSTEMQEYVTIGSANNYTDRDPDALIRTYYYRVAGVLKDTCSPTYGKKADSGPYSQSMSNIEDNRFQVGIKDNDYKNSAILIYPNPMSESTSLFFSNPEGFEYRLYLIDLSGKVCRIVENINTSEYMLKKGDLNQGLYFVELRGPKIFREKIVIK